MTNEPLSTGEVHEGEERFDFAVKYFVIGRFLLEISLSGDKGRGMNGAGAWPSIEKAKEITQQTATKLLLNAIISWDEGSRHERSSQLAQSRATPFHSS